MANELLTERRNDVLWLTLNRPDVHNAMNVAMTDALAIAVNTASEDTTLRAVIITASGEQSFCSGADLKENTGGLFLSRNGTNPIADVMRAIENCEKIVIARIDGRVLAGGIGLVAVCDLAYAAEHAEFGLPEVRVGLFPAMVAARLLEKMPVRSLQQMAYLAQPISAIEAETCGLITRAVSKTELDGVIEEALTGLRQNSPAALAAGKRAMLKMRDMMAGERLAFAEATIAEISRSDDAVEGRKAFSEKRKPRWFT